LFLLCLSIALFGGGYGLARIGAGSIETVGRAETKSRVFEARVYTVNDGKLEALQARMRNQAKLLEKHGITVIGYWVPEDAPSSHNTLISIWLTRAAKQPRNLWKNSGMILTGKATAGIRSQWRAGQETRCYLYGCNRLFTNEVADSKERSRSYGLF
jgi:hypothetical protein